MDSKCSCCGEQFEKKTKGFKRTSIHGKIRPSAQTVANVLSTVYQARITPGRDAYLCNSCTTLISSIQEKKENVRDAEERLRKIKLPGSYVGLKIPMTPTSVKRTRKRRRIFTPKRNVLFTPVKKKSPKPKSTKINLTLSNTVKGQAICQIAKSRYFNGFRRIIRASKKARNAMVKVVSELIRQEVNTCISSSVSVTLNKLMAFNWDTYIQEIKGKCPSLVELLTASLTRKQLHQNVCKRRGSDYISLIPTVGALLNIILFTRSSRCNILQLANSVMLWLGGCKRKVFDAFNKLGWCLGIKGTRSRIDEFRQDYDSKVLQWKAEASSITIGQSSEKEGAIEQTNDTLPALEDIWEDIESSEDSNGEAVGIEEAEEEQSSEMDTEQDTTETEDDSTVSCTDDSADELEDTLILDDDDDDDTILPADMTCDKAPYYDITFDNLNQKVGVRHHVRGKENKMLNMVQAFASKDRISTDGLSETLPEPDVIRNIPIGAYIPSPADEAIMKDELAVMVSRILHTHLRCFKDLSPVWHIPHRYTKESTWKSEIIPLGIIQKDETKTGEMIQILDMLQKYVPEDTDGNPITIPLYGDGLTCERAEGAQFARINGADKWTRLEMFEPAVQEWHMRLLYLQDTYDDLFKFVSHRERGTLFHVKQYFEHKAVSSKLMNCFDKAEELLEFTTNGYTISKAMEILQIMAMDEMPQNLPSEQTDKLVFLNSVVCKIINEIYEDINSQEIIDTPIDTTGLGFTYCMCKQDIGGTMVYCSNSKCDRGSWFHIECVGMTEDDIPDEDWYCCANCRAKVGRTKKPTVADRLCDQINTYARKLMWRGLNQIARKDAVKENDGPRMILH